jgi:cyclic beta-1,2-glucan synthetase
MAADVYSQAPYVGRGGWSWYTGAAAWMHRAAIESMFGLQQEAHSLSFTPCLPSDWAKEELTLRREGRTMRFILLRSQALTAPELTAEAGVSGTAELLRPGQRLDWRDLAPSTCFVVPLQEG